MSDIHWSKEQPNESGLWWYRPAPAENAQFQTVEYVAGTAPPLVIYHERREYRLITDDHFKGREWSGPVARRDGNGWRIEEFRRVE